MKDLKDKGAVVTGGASGIGLGIARALAKSGTHIVIADIREDKAGEAASELAKIGVRTSASACDVSDRSAVECCGLFREDARVRCGWRLRRFPLLRLKRCDYFCFLR